MIIIISQTFKEAMSVKNYYKTDNHLPLNSVRGTRWVHIIYNTQLQMYIQLIVKKTTSVYFFNPKHPHN